VKFFSRRRSIGIVDTRGSRISGWAHDPSAGGPVTIEVFVDGRKIGATPADRYRHDLVSVSGDGRCAFAFAIPPALLDGKPHDVEVRAAGAWRPLTNGRFSISLSGADLEQRVRNILRSGLWIMGGGLAGDSANLHGWTIAPPGSDGGRISLDGQPLTLQETDGREEWKSALLPDMAVRRFTATVPLDRSSSELHFSFGREQPFRPLHDYRYPLFDVPMPDKERRLRVHGYDSVFFLYVV
jgi:hypothetical protein